MSEMKIRNPTILHVTECFAGGVSRAIVARVHAFPEAEHHLFYSGSEGYFDATSWASVIEMPNTFVKRVNTLRQIVRNLTPDFIHAHSSWAGVYARTLKLSYPVIYEPHCFKHDDPSLKSVTRKSLRLIEKMLSYRTFRYAVLSEHEKKLVHDFAPSADTILIQNVPAIEIAQHKNLSRSDDDLIVTIGRVAPQKDPKFFISAITEIRRTHPDVNFLWIGDGDPKLVRMLRNQGVQVTGWLGPDEVAAYLDESSAYIHTAAYEGFPLSILDAAARGVPIIARSIPSLGDSGLILCQSPETLAHKVVAMLQNFEIRQAAQEASASLIATKSKTELALALKRLYSYDICKTGGA